MDSSDDQRYSQASFLAPLIPIDHSKQIAAVIVSMQNGPSYDQLFKKVQQKSAQGTQVVVFTCGSQNFKQIQQVFQGQTINKFSKQLKDCINKVDPDCVVFNWQCSQFYDQQKFSNSQQNIFKLLKIILSKGYMAMFSDFSLKALIKNWNQQYLGPNPFIRVGQTNFPVEISFNPNTLKQCPSAQLQIVGQMAENGTCSVDVMPSTITYAINKLTPPNEIYKLQILTVVTNQILPLAKQRKKKVITSPKKQMSEKIQVKKKVEMPLELNKYEGNVGHVLLTYKQGGGHLLTSMGHWIQLMKIDTSTQKVLQLAKQQYGQKEYLKMKKQYQQVQQSKRKEWVNVQSKKFVQNRAPCRDMNRKRKKQ